MAYFANGEEGYWYEEKICERCVHHKSPESEEVCPVWELHLMYNYDQTKEEAIGTALDLLIPRRGIHNDLCSMFHPSKAEYVDHGANYKAWLEEKEGKS